MPANAITVDETADARERRRDDSGTFTASINNEVFAASDARAELIPESPATTQPMYRPGPQVLLIGTWQEGAANQLETLELRLAGVTEVGEYRFDENNVTGRYLVDRDGDRVIEYGPEQMEEGVVTVENLTDRRVAGRFRATFRGEEGQPLVVIREGTFDLLFAPLD